MPAQPSEKNIQRIDKLVSSYCAKSGTVPHPDPEITKAVVLGLARHLDELGRPLCPCRFYPDKKEEITHRTWICPCDDMNVYKYCHCLLFTNSEGVPITEHLPQDQNTALGGVIGGALARSRSCPALCHPVYFWRERQPCESFRSSIPRHRAGVFSVGQQIRSAGHAGQVQ